MLKSAFYKKKSQDKFCHSKEFTIEKHGERVKVKNDLQVIHCRNTLQKVYYRKGYFFFISAHSCFIF